MQIAAPDADSAPAPKRPRGRPAGAKNKPKGSTCAPSAPEPPSAGAGASGARAPAPPPEHDAEAAPRTEVSPRGPLPARPRASAFPRKNRINLAGITVDAHDASLEFRRLFRPFWPPPLVSRSRAGSDIFGSGIAPPCRSLTTSHSYPTPCRRRLRLPRMSSGGCCGTGTRAWIRWRTAWTVALALALTTWAVTQTPPGMTKTAPAMSRSTATTAMRSGSIGRWRTEMMSWKWERQPQVRRTLCSRGLGVSPAGAGSGRPAGDRQ